MTLRWVEIGGTSTFVEGNAPIPVTTLGAALAPPSILNLMKAEINRVIILSKDDIVVPVAMEIPRRQYIDFHAELYPPVADIGAFLILVAIFFLIFTGLTHLVLAMRVVPAQSGQAWLEGSDVTQLMISPNPTHAAVPASTSSPAVQSSSTLPPSISTSTHSIPRTSPIGVIASSVADTPSSPVISAAAIPPSSLPASTTIPSIPAPASSPATTAPASRAASSVATSPTSVATKTPAARWSRKFLTGSTHLKPDYFDLRGLSTTMSADCQLIKVSFSYFRYEKVDDLI
jgi:coronin-7